MFDFENTKRSTYIVEGSPRLFIMTSWHRSLLCEKSRSWSNPFRAVIAFLQFKGGGLIRVHLIFVE
ncbi:hypothetical protein LguiA_012284 [Lonicera macranthoides]